MKNYYVRFDDDWADEMDVGGICIIEENKYNEFKDAIEFLEKYEKENGNISVSMAFGTNEDNDYDSFKDFLVCFEYDEIPENELEIAKKYVWDSGRTAYYGMTRIIDIADDCKRLMRGIE